MTPITPIFHTQEQIDQKVATNILRATWGAGVALHYAEACSILDAGQVEALRVAVALLDPLLAATRTDGPAAAGGAL